MTQVRYFILISGQTRMNGQLVPAMRDRILEIDEARDPLLLCAQIGTAIQSLAAEEEISDARFEHLQRLG